MWISRILYLVSLVGAGVFYLFYTGVFSTYLLIFVVLLPLLSLLTGMLGAVGVKCALSGDGVFTMGERVDACLTFYKSRKLSFPFWGIECDMLLHNAYHGTEETLRLVFPAGTRRKIDFSVPTDRCGHVDVKVARAYVPDPLRLFALPVKRSAQISAIVLPSADLSDRGISFSPPDLSIGPKKPKPGGGSAEDHEVRTYRPGDPVRSIHWKLSAKTEEPVVREALVPIYSQLYLTAVKAQTPQAADRTAANMLWVTKLLTDRGQSFVLWSKTPVSVLDATDRNTMIQQFLSLPQGEHAPYIQLPPESTVLAVSEDSVREVNRHVLMGS